MLFRAGKIDALVHEPVIHFVIDGAPVKMANGHKMKFTPDWSYVEDGRVIYEDLKSSTGYLARDVPVKIALFKHMNPHIEFRITK